MGRNQSTTNNSRRTATPVLGFLLGKCRAALITLHVIGAALFLPIYLCVSRTEAFLMVSNTSFLSVYRVASALSCCIRTWFVAYECLAVFVPNLEYKGNTLLYFD
jgi:hypothetical protein